MALVEESKQDNLESGDPRKLSEYQSAQIKNKIPQSHKPEIPKPKGKIAQFYVESVIIDSKARFLCKDESGILSIKESIELEDKIFRPVHAEECGYLPYSFTSDEEIQSLYCSDITNDQILFEIKQLVDHFIVAKNEAKTLLQGDCLITYCQEWINTLHYPYSVGETESGKSSILHLAKWLCYRCLYGEDIPNADVYNFLGLDEEGTGTICEDEAQDIWRNNEKMNMYKNSYSKGSKKPRIIGTDSLKRRQVFYKTFCPKWFAGEKIPGNKGFLERLAVINMIEGQPEGNIKRPTNEEVHQLHQLRNKILIWKLQNIGNDFKLTSSELKGRDQELWEDFLSIGYNTKYYDEFKKVVSFYTEQRHDKIKNSIESKLFKLVCDKINKDLELEFIEFWDYLTKDNEEIPGKINNNTSTTFYPEEYLDKITHHYLSKIFEYKFQSIKEIKKIRDEKGKQHQITIYRFRRDVIDSLLKKYGIGLPIDHFLYLGEVGEHGDQRIDKVDQGNQVNRKEENE